MNFRFILCAGENREELELINLADQSRRKLAYQEILAEDFAL
jgi:hypothetical protein